MNLLQVLPYNRSFSDAGSCLSMLMPNVLESVPPVRFSFQSSFHLWHYFRSKMNTVKEELRKLGISSESNTSRLESLGLEVSRSSNFFLKILHYKSMEIQFIIIFFPFRLLVGY